MATKLTKPVTRVINDVVGGVMLTGSGVVFSKGRRKFGVIPWAFITKLVALPVNIPSKFAGNPMGCLTELGK